MINTQLPTFQRLSLRLLFLARALPAVLALAAIAVTSQSFAQLPAPIDLGHLGGGSTEATSAADGFVVGKSLTNISDGGGGYLTHAFIWSASTRTMTDIGAQLPGTGYSWARSVNSRGEVVGFAAASDWSWSKTFYWSAASGYRFVCDTTWNNGEITALINEGGTVAGADASGTLFRWTLNGGRIDCGSTGGGSAVITGINSQGDFVGNTWDEASANLGYGGVGFVALTSSNTITILRSQGKPTAPSFCYQNEGGYDLRINGINDQRVVVGTYWDLQGRYYINGGFGGTDAVHNQYAFKWTPTGGFTDLGRLGSWLTPEFNYTLFSSSAAAINNSGVIIGASSPGTRGFFPTQAFSYRGSGPMTALPTPAYPYYGSSARSLNDDGDIAGDADGQMILWRNGVMQVISAPSFARDYPSLFIRQHMLVGNSYGPESVPPYGFQASHAWVISLPSAAPRPVVTSDSATGTYGSSFSYQISATNSPTSYGATGLPSGLSVNSSSGAITGTPTQQGSFTVNLSATNAGGTGSGTLTLTIAKGTATITLGDLSQTYDGTLKSATATTTPAGLTVAFTYVGGRINAGSYSFTANINDANYNGSTTGTLVISKANATVTLGSLSQPYNGTPRSASATTVPGGLNVDFSYNGSATAPTALGTYAVVGTINDTNYAGTASGSMTITRGTAAVTLGSLAQTYDGSPKAASATTSPAGLTVNFTYDGSATAPTSAGTYAVVGTVNDSNYDGTASGTLTITKATAPIVLGGLAQTYDGSPKSVTATTTPAGLTVDLTYNGSATAPTGAGSYAVVGTINNSNYSGTVSGTLTIAKANATVTLSDLTPTYDGSAKSVTATTTPAGLNVSLTYNGAVQAPTAAGSYAVVGTINDSNYSGTASGTLTIAKATATVALANLAQSYDGSAKSATATTTPANLTVNLTYDGAATAPTAVGSYAVVATVNDTNYAGTASGTLVVSKGAATVTLGSLVQTYDGSPKPITATTVPAGLTVDFTYNGSPTAPTAAGSYPVVGTVNSPNYTGTASGTLVINKGVATILLASLTQMYDGTARVVTATTAPNGLPVTFTYDGASMPPVNAGTYAVVATVNAPNYVGTATGTLTVSKAPALVTLGSLAQTYNGQPKPATATTTPGGLPVVLTYNGSPSAPINAGSYTVVGTINHQNFAGTATGTLQVAKARATVRVANSTLPYNGTPQGATATTLPANLPVRFTYNGSPTAPTAIGTYFVVGTIDHINYSGSGSGQLRIVRGTPTISLSNLTQAYDGTPKPVVATTTPAGLPVTVTYAGISTVPKAVGSYAVVATVSTPNYYGTRSGTLTITKGIATVTFSSLAQTFDGRPKTALATTTPAGLALNYVYPGGTPPTAPGTYTVTANVADANYGGSATGPLTIAPVGPSVSNVSPNSIVGGTTGVAINVYGSGFTPSAVVRFGTTTLATNFVNGSMLMATVPPSLVPSPANGINIVPITVNNNNVVSTSLPFTVQAASVSRIQTVSAPAGQTVTSTTTPTAAGQTGLSATFAHSQSAGQPATLTTATYSGNPTTATRIDTGGGIVDLQITGADPLDTATVKFYYSSAVTGLAETNLRLRYFNGTTWVAIQSSGGVSPLKSTTNNLDGTVSGGRFTVTFSNTSTPKITELSGTVIAMAINQAPVASAGPDQTVDATAGNEAFVTLNGGDSTDPDDGDILTYEWREGKTVLGTDATLVTTLEVGVHTLTLQVTDEAGATSTDTLVVTVRDAAPPVLLLPVDTVYYTDKPNGRVVTYKVRVLGQESEVKDIRFSYSKPSGSVFPLGQTTVTVTATDAAGNVATGSFTVTVVLKLDGDDAEPDDQEDEKGEDRR